jgi:hypothetical protein
MKQNCSPNGSQDAEGEEELETRCIFPGHRPTPPLPVTYFLHQGPTSNFSPPLNNVIISQGIHPLIKPDPSWPNHLSITPPAGDQVINIWAFLRTLHILTTTTCNLNNPQRTKPSLLLCCGSFSMCKFCVYKTWGRLKLGKVWDLQKLHITFQINRALAQGPLSPGPGIAHAPSTRWLLDGNHLVAPSPRLA